MCKQVHKVTISDIDGDIKANITFCLNHNIQEAVKKVRLLHSDSVQPKNLIRLNAVSLFHSPVFQLFASTLSRKKAKQNQVLP